MGSEPHPEFEWYASLVQEKEKWSEYEKVREACRKTFYLIYKKHKRAKLVLKNKDETELKLLREEFSEHYKDLKKDLDEFIKLIPVEFQEHICGPYRGNLRLANHWINKINKSLGETLNSEEEEELSESEEEEISDSDEEDTPPQSNPQKSSHHGCYHQM